MNQVMQRPEALELGSPHLVLALAISPVSWKLGKRAQTGLMLALNDVGAFFFFFWHELIYK